MLLCQIQVSFAQIEKPFFTLYGFKLGQNIEVVVNELGKPSKIVEFKDGWKAYVYFLDKHNVVFETDNSGSKNIMSIQLSGNEQPAGRGLDAINLGDDAQAVVAILGVPTLISDAVDLATQEPLEKTKIYFYGYYLSIEEANKKINSIKITYTTPLDADNYPDFEKLVQYAKDENLYKLQEYISIYLMINGKTIISHSLLYELENNQDLHELVFGSSGLKTLTHDNIKNITLRLNIEDIDKKYPATTGYVYQLEHDYISELYFARSYEGWVLIDVFINDSNDNVDE